jgi:hypothetical protein
MGLPDSRTFGRIHKRSSNLQTTTTFFRDRRLLNDQLVVGHSVNFILIMRQQLPASIFSRRKIRPLLWVSSSTVRNKRLLLDASRPVCFWALWIVP